MDSSDQSLIGLLGHSTFLVNHSLALPLSHVPKNCTWVSVYLTPKRPCNLSHHSIPAMNVSYTLRSEPPEYSSGGLIFSLVHVMTESLGLSSPCTLSDHGNHDPLLGIPKQFLLPVINAFRYQVQWLVLVGLFTHAIPCTLLMYRLWHIYAFWLPLVS